MKIYKKEDKDLQFDTEGWMKFSDFLKEAIDYVNSSRYDDTRYNLGDEPYDFLNIKDTTIELGTYLVADSHMILREKTARIGISQLVSAHNKGHREFTILGIDFSEVGYICSIPNFFQYGLIDYNGKD